MAKVVKKKKRRMSLAAKGFIFLVISLICLLASSLYIGTTNASLAIKIQKINAEISTLKSENQNLNIQIQSLQNKERVYTIAQDAGLDQNQENVVSIRNVEQ